MHVYLETVSLYPPLHVHSAESDQVFWAGAGLHNWFMPSKWYYAEQSQHDVEDDQRNDHADHDHHNNNDNDLIFQGVPENFVLQGLLHLINM